MEGDVAAIEQACAVFEVGQRDALLSNECTVRYRRLLRGACSNDCSDTCRILLMKVITRRPMQPF